MRLLNVPAGRHVLIVDAIWVVLLLFAWGVGAPLRWLLLIVIALQVPVALLFMLARHRAERFAVLVAFVYVVVGYGALVIGLFLLTTRLTCMPMKGRKEVERPSRHSCHRALHACVDKLISEGCAQPPAPGSLPEGTAMMNALSCAASVNRCQYRLAECRGAP